MPKAKIVIYTTNNCPYCVLAKKLLTSLNEQFEEISLQDDDDLRQKLSLENKGWRTVPMIFINDKFMGGFDNINELHKAGELTKLLE